MRIVLLYPRASRGVGLRAKPMVTMGSQTQVLNTLKECFTTRLKTQQENTGIFSNGPHQVGTKIVELR